MGFPTIIFDATNGSDTQASGAGPDTAVFGTQARTSAPGTTTVIDLSLDAPDLSEVLDDGTHCLWISCASGRQFSKITAVDDSAKTVTVADAVGTSTTGLTWGIGGLRKNFSTASSLTLFGSAGAKPGWTIRTLTDQSISAVITLGTSGDTTSGHITIEGDSPTSHRVINQTSASTRSFTAGAINYIQFKNLKFTHSHATKTNAQAMANSAGITGWRFVNCIFGDATNKLPGMMMHQDTVNILMIDCEVCKTSTGTDGISINVGTSVTSTPCYTMIGCSIHDCARHGIYLQNAGAVSFAMDHCLVYANGGDGINYGAACRFPHIKNSIINGNTGDGIDLGSSVQIGDGAILNTHITNNGAYGITAASGQGAIGLINYCNFYGNTTADRLNVTAGDNDTAVNPAFTSASTGNFTPTSATYNSGFPLSTRYIGANQSLTRAYVDIGPQLQGDFPAVGNVLTTDTTNGAAGTYVAPTQSAYLTTGPGYGAGGATSGTATQPAAADVTSGVTYGYVAATQAVGYITFSDANGFSGSVNVNGTTISIDDAGLSPDVQWGTDAEMATSLATFINENISGVTASATDNVVTITVTAAGSAGNSTTLTTTDQTHYAKTAFAGGANATTRTGTKTAGGGGGLRGRL